MGPVAAVRDFVAAHMLFVNTVVTTDLILCLDCQSGAVEISVIFGCVFPTHLFLRFRLGATRE